MVMSKLALWFLNALIPTMILHPTCYSHLKLSSVKITHQLIHVQQAIKVGEKGGSKAL